MDKTGSETSPPCVDVRLIEVPDLLKGLGAGKGVCVETFKKLESERLLRKLDDLLTVFRPAAKSIRSYDTCACENSGSSRYSADSTFGCEMQASFIIKFMFRCVCRCNPILN